MTLENQSSRTMTCKPLDLTFFSLFVSAEVIKAFSYQCRTTEEINRMWDACKVSIGKRCQHLRKSEKENRQNQKLRLLLFSQYSEIALEFVVCDVIFEVHIVPVIE